MIVNVSEWKIGDVVHLKSGGPMMTVTTVDEVHVTCTFFCCPSEGDWVKKIVQLPLDAVEKTDTGEKS